MGTVYDCRDPVIGRRVAIKTVSKDTLDSSEADALLGRFKQEAQAAGRLNHPGVVSIYDYGESNEVAFIAMEYISGKELKKLFDTGEKFTLPDVVRIMGEILDALDHAHRNKVVHRDIKPANIMITDDGRVKVADFGVAKIESSMATQVGTRIGTPAYMAPEQHRMLAVDGRSDLFSCGVILYQFLTGERPFTGGSQTIARNILTQTPTPPSERNATLTPVWDSLVRKALAKRPDERFQIAREFKEALEHAVGNPSSATGASLGGAAQASTNGTARNRGADTPPPADRVSLNPNAGRTERSDVAMESELEFWKEIKDSDHPEDFEAFVESFPEGRFSHLARRRLDRLRRQSEQDARDETVLSGARAPVGNASPIGARDSLADEELTQLSGIDSPSGAAAAKREAEEQARSKLAEAKAKEEQARRLAEEQARRQEEARKLAEVKAKQEEARKLAEAKARQIPGGQGSPAARPAQDDPDATYIRGNVDEADATVIRHKESDPDATYIRGNVDDADTTVIRHKGDDRSAASAKAPPAVSTSPVAVGSNLSANANVAARLPNVTDKAPTAKPATTLGQSARIADAARQTDPGEQPSQEPEAKKKPVAVFAGIAVALAAAGAGWFFLATPPKGTSTVALEKSAEPSTQTPSPERPGASTPPTSAPKPADASGVPPPSQTAAPAEGHKGEPEGASAAEKSAAQAKAAAEKLAAEKVAAEKAAAEKAANEKLAAAKSASEKAAAAKLAEKAAADKAAADKAVADKLAAEKAAADKAAADRLAADRLAAERAAAEKAAADKAAADKAAADRLAAEKAAADKLAADRAASERSAGSIADRIAAASAPAELYKRALALRNEGKVSQAVPLLRQAASQGHGPSSKLLVTIFTDGAGDVRANFREAERYQALAKTQGE